MDKVYTYKDQEENKGPVQYSTKKKRMPSILLAVIITLIVFFLLYVFIGFDDFKNDVISLFNGTYNSDYVATIYIRDELNENSAGLYNHKYILKLVNDLEKDSKNKGIILWVNTPGGTVYASDELYLKLKEYIDKTGRPIYSSYQSMAASGGYYISCLSDKIYANRNCWTGSIGVTMGEYIDVTGLLDKLGVRVNTITAGKNKAMGSEFVEMTDEQKAILQSLVDEAYEQFTGIVSEERGLNIDYVKELADGRVYTAAQAKENQLIDEIGTYEDCIKDIKSIVGNNVIIKEYKTSASKKSILSLLGDSEIDEKEMSVSEIERLIEMNGQFQLSYMSTIRK